MQNIHLSKSFLTEIERKLEQLHDSTQVSEVNINFRMILTSAPCDYIPINILMNCVKLTNEPARGIKNQIVRYWSQQTSDHLLPHHIVGYQQNRILFTLSVFHAVLIERRKFGPVGFQEVYNFNESDLDQSFFQVKNLINYYDSVPWETIHYLVGTIVYGGRITDYWDFRVLKYTLERFLSHEKTQLGSTFQGIEGFSVSDCTDIHELQEKFQTMQIDDYNPDLFGINPTAPSLH